MVPHRPLRSLLLATALALSAACAAHRPAPATPLETTWQSTLHRDHPLVGRIWDVRAGRLAAPAELEAAVARGRFVLLGETHDNPDHHRLQARLLQAVVGAGRRPALAFEMLDPAQQPSVDAALAGPGADAGALGRAVGWDESGWPPFETYRPIFDVGLRARLPVVAANLSRREAREVVHRGAGALPAPLQDLLARAGPLGADEAHERREEMEASHCGQLPEAFLDPMVLSQRARDAQLALSTLGRAGGDGAVLITGAEHARRDRGAAAFLATAGVKPREIVSVAFREVDPGAESPADYGPLPFDWVVFTPGAERGDPCEGFRRPAGAAQAAASSGR